MDTIYGFAWDYDRMGNRTCQRQVGVGGGTADSPAETYYEYDAANQLAPSHAVGGDAPGWTYYEHDARGNLALVREPDGATYFAYNGAGLAESVRFKGGACNYFHYDAQMRRSAIEEGAGATYFAWDKDALAPVLARTPSADAEESFVRGRAPVPGAGDLAARIQKEGGQAHVRYDIFDHLGNVHLVVDGSGEPVAQRAFNAWGEAIALAGGAVAKRRGQCSPAWRGLPDDPESRYWLTPTRVYDAKAGRFLSRDPKGFVDGMGLYLAYFVPHGIDPQGLQWWNPRSWSWRRREAEDADIDTVVRTVESILGGALELLPEFLERAMRRGDVGEAVNLLRYATDTRSPAKYHTMSRKAIVTYLRVATESAETQMWIDTLNRYSGVFSKVLEEITGNLVDFLKGFSNSQACMRLYQRAMEMDKHCVGENANLCRCIDLCKDIHRQYVRCYADIQDSMGRMSGGIASMGVGPGLFKIFSSCHAAENRLRIERRS